MYVHCIGYRQRSVSVVMAPEPHSKSSFNLFLVYILKEKRFYWKFAQKFMSEYSSYVPMIFVCPIPQNEVILPQ